MSETPTYDELVALLGEPNLDPGPDWEVVVAQALAELVAVKA